METVNCKGLSFTYPETANPALSDISFTVEKGEFCLVMGASAAGKSTLLKLLKKEIAPAGEKHGELEIFGTAGYVSQNVEESIVCNKVRWELSFGLTNMGMSGDSIELSVAETASYFNLESKLDSDISTLSGGEKQMVNLAAVMIMKPEILVLDEPCSQLDPVSAQRFVQSLKRIHEDFGITVIISEHSTDDFFDYADSIMLLDHGSLYLKDRADKVLNRLKADNHPMLKAVPISYQLDLEKVKQHCNCIPHDRKHLPLRLPLAIEMKNVFFAYEKGKDILNGLSLRVYKGRINAVVGPNSSGKSTLLKVIAGVNQKYRGKLKMDGNVSMLCQNVFDLFTKERCGDEVRFGEITDFLEISNIENKHPYDLSGGQAQRLALAKVLERNVDIILLDEPTKGLDALLKIKLASLLEELCRRGKTILIVSHDIEFIGAYCDYASFLSRGRIITTAPRREFFSSVSFYTTAVSRRTGGRYISLKDLENEYENKNS